MCMASLLYVIQFFALILLCCFLSITIYELNVEQERKEVIRKDIFGTLKKYHPKVKVMNSTPPYPPSSFLFFHLLPFSPLPFLPTPFAFQWAELVPVNSHAQSLKFWWPWEICLLLEPHRHFSGQLKDVWTATSMLFYTGNQAIFVLLWF